MRLKKLEVYLQFSPSKGDFSAHVKQGCEYGSDLFAKMRMNRPRTPDEAMNACRFVLGEMGLEVEEISFSGETGNIGIRRRRIPQLQRNQEAVRETAQKR